MTHKLQYGLDLYWNWYSQEHFHNSWVTKDKSLSAAAACLPLIKLGLGLDVWVTDRNDCVRSPASVGG